MKHFAKHSLRSVLLCVFSVFLITLSGKISGQTNPTPFNVTANTHSIFTSWASTSTSGTAPANMAFWVANGRQESTAPAVVGDWNCAYSLTTGTRFIGKGVDGISMVNTGSTATTTCSNPTVAAVYPYAVVLALSTINRASLQIAWTGGTVSTGARPYILQLQYRIGTTNPFVDIIGATYTGAATGNSQALTSSLPIACENQALVQLRWIYIQPTTGSGTRPELRLDEILVNSSPASPTLTVTPTSIPAFNYVSGNGPSTASSYTLSGAVLTPTAGDITVTAPTNFEVSKTGVTTEFADNLTVAYTSGGFMGTSIYARLKTGLPINSYNGNIMHSGGGVSSPPNVVVSGSVTAVPPPVITTTGTLTAFSTFIGNPSSSQSYTVSGVNLVNDIIVTAPTGFQVKTGAGAYASSLMLSPSSGSVPTTTIDVRMPATATGTFSGNITHASMNVSPTVDVAVSGTVVAACATPTAIATIRAGIPEQASTTATVAVTIAGRVTARFGNSKFYLQDASGGMAVYSNFSGGVAQSNGIVVGDSIVITGLVIRFNGEIEMVSTTSTTTPAPFSCINRVAGSGASTTPALFVFDSNNPPSGVNLATFLDVNEGRRVKIISANLITTGNFTASTNYPISTCNGQGDSEIRIDASASQTLTGTTIPAVTQDITGVIGHFITSTGAVNILQIFPSSPSGYVKRRIGWVTCCRQSSTTGCRSWYHYWTTNRTV